MAIIEKLADIVLTAAIEGYKSKKTNRRKQKEFIRTWDEIRDAYLKRYGEDVLYNFLWKESDFRAKEVLAKIRKLPSSREFVEKLYNYICEEMKADVDIDSYVRFFTVFYEYMLDNTEFSNVMINIRNDQEKNGRYTMLLHENPLQITDNLNANTIDNSQVIDLYASNYSQIMFMQKKEEPQIRLMDLYVENEYSIIQGEESELGLEEYIAEFATNKFNSPALFIEGHAGIGKSSLFSKIAYDYKKNNNQWNNKNIIIIQLRNLVSEGTMVNTVNPWADFKKYLHYDGNITDFMEMLNNTILVLDGFDELCMIDNIRLDNKLKYVSNILNFLEDYRSGCKIIITTRPNYLSKKSDWYLLTKRALVISLNHFSDSAREEWIRKAKKAGMKIDGKVERGILSEHKEDVNVIASTPLTLYLVAHEGIVIEKDDELWAIYQRIFGRETIRKRYDLINIDDSITPHPAEKLSDMIYSTTKEIAFYMHEKNKMDVINSEIEICISRAIAHVETTTNLEIEKGNIHDILKDNYALFNYYKESSLNGGISFYHNYIREFFLQEKIFEILEKIYSEIVALFYENPQQAIQQFKENTIQFLSVAKISDKTIDFLRSHSVFLLNNPMSWVNLERRNHWLQTVFTDIMIDDNNYFTENLLLNLWQTLKVINSLYSDEKQDMYDRKRITQINRSKDFFTKLECIAKQHEIRDTNFDDINICGKTIQDIIFINCSFNNANMAASKLYNVIFDSCSMDNICLNGTDADRIYLRNSSIEESNMRGMYMVYCEISGCIITNTNMSGTRILHSNINKTDIYKAKLMGTDFFHTRISDLDSIIKYVKAFKYSILDNYEWKDEKEKNSFIEALHNTQYPVNK